MAGDFDESLPDAALAVISDNYSSLWLCVLSLLEIMLLDSPSDKYRLLLLHMPSLSLVFFPIMLLTSIVLMNLVTAVIVLAWDVPVRAVRVPIYR